jgi:hypothetical protein
MSVWMSRCGLQTTQTVSACGSVGKHGSSLRSLAITADGGWMDRNVDDPSHANVTGAWSRLWYKLLSAQSAAPRLEHVTLSRKAAGSVAGSLHLPTTPHYLSVPVSVLSLFPRQTVTTLNLATPDPQDRADETLSTVLGW